MPDNFWGTISVGGKIKPQDIDEFVDSVDLDLGETDEFTRDDFDRILVAPIGSILGVDDGEGWSVKGGVLRLLDHRAHYGEFPNTEDFCIKHGIPFERTSEPAADHNGEEVYYRPDFDGWQELADDFRLVGDGAYIVYTDCNGAPILETSSVAKHAEVLTNFFEGWEKLDKASPDDAQRMSYYGQDAVGARVAASLLQAMLPVKFTPLSPLTVSE
jgi:hypothetical protein